MNTSKHNDTQHEMTRLDVTTPEESELMRLARASLDDSVSRLDAATLSKLNQARHRALEESRRPFLQRFWLPMGVAATLLAVAIALPIRSPQPGEATSPDSYHSAAEDAALVEDLDLVLSLMEEEDHAS